MNKIVILSVENKRAKGSIKKEILSRFKDAVEKAETPQQKARLYTWACIELDAAFDPKIISVPAELAEDLYDDAKYYESLARGCGTSIYQELHNVGLAPILRG